MKKNVWLVIGLLFCGSQSALMEARNTNVALLAGGSALTIFSAYHFVQCHKNARIHEPLNAMVAAPLGFMQIKWLTDVEAKISGEDYQMLASALTDWTNSVNKSAVEQAESFKKLKKVVEVVKSKYPFGVLRVLGSCLGCAVGAAAILVGL